MYAVQISFTLDDQYQSIILTSVQEDQVSLSSDVTTHPLPNGTIAADHMIIQPIEVNVDGTVGLISSDSISSLSQFQTQMERVKNECVFCEVVKLKTNSNNKIIFNKRKNLVLKRISWTEGTVSLGYSFSFIEVLQYDAAIKESSFMTGISDQSFLQSTSFVESLIDWSNIDSYLSSLFVQLGVCSESYVNSYWTTYRNAAAPVLVGGIAGGAVTASLVGTAAGLGIITLGAGVTATGVGAIVGLGIIVVGLIVTAVIATVNATSATAEATAKFSEFNEQSAVEFTSFYEDIKAQLLAFFEADTKSYAFSVDGSQRAYLTLSNSVFRFDVKEVINKTSTTVYDTGAGGEIGKASSTTLSSRKTSMNIYELSDSGERLVASFSDISGVTKQTLNECNANARIMWTGKGDEQLNVFLMSDGSSLMSHHYLLVTHSDPTKYTTRIEAIVRNSFM